MVKSPEAVRHFGEFIHRELGINFFAENAYQLEHRLEEVARQLGFSTVDELWHSTNTHLAGEIRRLVVDFATNNETQFFRDPQVFAAVGALMSARREEGASRGVEHVRLWSAACSYGQEPFSLVMTLDGLTGGPPPQNVEIVASDVSERVLRAARTGLFTQLQVQRGLDPAMLAKYFRRCDRPEGEPLWEFRQDLLSRVRFLRQNLVESFHNLGTFDLILCRNVLIYQDLEGKRRIVERMHSILNRGGVLILGSSESLIGVSEKFRQLRVQDAIVYCKE